MTIFDEVRERVSITDAISYLGMKPTETKGDQLRFGCPKCGGSDRRTLSINVSSGKFQCFTAKKGGNDATDSSSAFGTSPHGGLASLSCSS